MVWWGEVVLAVVCCFGLVHGPARAVGEAAQEESYSVEGVGAWVGGWVGGVIEKAVRGLQQQHTSKK